MGKPRVFIDRGYFYYKCDTHHIKQSNVGIASHAEAMNVAAMHYHFHHKTQQKAPR